MIVGRGCRRRDERRDRASALPLGRRHQHPQRSAPRSRRHAFHRRRHRRRLGHPGHARNTGSTPPSRSPSAPSSSGLPFGILRETMNILLEGTPRGMKLDQSRSRHPQGRRRQRRPRPPRLEHRLGKPCALLPYRHRRHPAVGQRAHPARREGSPPPRLPRDSHHHPVRARRVRSRPRLHHPGGRRRASPPSLGRFTAIRTYFSIVILSEAKDLCTLPVEGCSGSVPSL